MPNIFVQKANQETARILFLFIPLLPGFYSCFTQGTVQAFTQDPPQQEFSRKTLAKIFTQDFVSTLHKEAPRNLVKILHRKLTNTQKAAQDFTLILSFLPKNLPGLIPGLSKEASQYFTKEAA